MKLNPKILTQRKCRGFSYPTGPIWKTISVWRGENQRIIIVVCLFLTVLKDNFSWGKISVPYLEVLSKPKNVPGKFFGSFLNFGNGFCINLHNLFTELFQQIIIPQIQRFKNITGYETPSEKEKKKSMLQRLCARPMNERPGFCPWWSLNWTAAIFSIETYSLLM